MNKCFTPFHDNVIQCLQKLKPSQTRKKTDEESTSSRLSIKSLQKLEEAKTKLKITERAIELKRQKSKLIIEENLNVAKYKQAQEDLENELELLKCQGELELAESKVKFEMMEDEGHVCDLGLPRINSVDKSREYVEKITLGPKQVKPESQKEEQDRYIGQASKHIVNQQLPRQVPAPAVPHFAQSSTSTPQHSVSQPVMAMYPPRPMQYPGQAYMPQLMQPRYTPQPLPPRFPPQVMQPRFTPTSQSYRPPPIAQPHLDSTFTPRHQYQPISSSVIDSAVTSDTINCYLLKKDLVSQRLRRYDDDPSSYNVWKGTFKTIVSEATLSDLEEIDLLLRWLGPESTVQVTSIRRANPDDAKIALQKIWERLDERYGSPELIESKLRIQVQKFPVITLPKDKTQLYNLADLLAEIECHKNNDRYAMLLSYYDTPIGVNPIVCKLPENLQNKWRDRAVKYKIQNIVPYPPFQEFVKFIHELSISLNDPSFSFESSSPVGMDKQRFTRRPATVMSRKTEVQEEKENIRKEMCSLHPHAISHNLDECQLFMRKPMEERRRYVTENKLCFRCLRTKFHNKKHCRAYIKCKECGSGNHVTAMHIKPRNQDIPQSVQGGESEPFIVDSKCTSICDGFHGRSCAKTVLVQVYPENRPELSVTVYAMLDGHCNRTLATTELMDSLGVKGNELMYNLMSCSGRGQTLGRQAHGFIVQSLDSSTVLKLPTLIECRSIPQDVTEIPTPEIAYHYPHLRSIASEIPKYDPNHQIGLLIGRDLTDAHYVYQQITGPKNHPFAQKTCFGWVIIGDVCLNGKHLPEVSVRDLSVTSFKTNILPNGRPTIFQPCDKDLQIHIQSVDGELDIFRKHKDDEEIGLSVEDREFIHIMENEMKLEEGNWTAPLPFKRDKPAIPNNKVMALKRAMVLDSSLYKNYEKRQHFFTFMEKVIQSGAAEIAPELKVGQEVWYLPLFGVYHPKKPDQIRGVFDSSATYKGTSLNSVLLTGPNLTNNLVGVLLRFRKDSIAISADIEQMFYSFLVREDHRDYLRFMWYQNNDPSKHLVEYRMRAHVFGNCPSPAVATFGLRKSVENSEQDIKDFVNNNFYVDDALTSVPNASQAIDLLKRTRTALKTNGNINLHKVASNNKEVMLAFSKEDLSKEIKQLDLEKDLLPVHHSLGLLWDLSTDSFLFDVNFPEKPNTRRGYLSMLHSIYDPLGFIGPLVICGKIILREITTKCDWDDDVDSSYVHRWESWKRSISSLQNISIPRMYITKSLSLCDHVELYVFCDASEQAVSAVSYIKVPDEIRSEVSFVFGKVKLAPLHGHSMPRLELCAALMAVEIAETVKRHLNITFVNTWFYSDSKIVLGYISNHTKRFYNYVANRVERILRSSSPSQWNYVKSEENPADVGTRGLSTAEDLSCKWLKGPEFLHISKDLVKEYFPLVNPHDDKEIRINANKLMLKTADLTNRFEKFSTWNSLISAVTVLKTAARKWKHMTFDSLTIKQESELFVVKETQKTFFLEELLCLQDQKPLPRDSSIRNLCPYLDQDGIMRIGGRLNLSVLPMEQKNPIILPRKSHVAKLIVLHFHEKTGAHQGRHITEGVIRNNGYWVIGARKLISSVIHKCVVCKRLRGNLMSQKMADLPSSRVTPGPPFSAVGVDTFGPWSIVTRKTRGGVAESKRWAIMFTCLTTRAVHIELVESMSSSSFINALRRFIALRGNVCELRSDRGTNFIGATGDLNIDVIQGPVKHFLDQSKIKWIFNAPHSSHMGGVWERMIGVTRRILDALLLGPKGKNLTHEVLSTMMAEVTAIMNSRPITTISSDPDMPFVLSPAILLNQKISGHFSTCVNVSIRDLYKEQWKQVQVLSDFFWKQWNDQYLHTLQSRRKWTTETPNLKPGDVVIVRDKDIARCQWPVGLVEEVIQSADELVRKVRVRLIVNGKPCTYMRPISELIRLIE
ncbi:uncharacterized protein [Magallana gigas]